MKRKILNILKSIGLILFLLAFPTFFFIIFNIDFTELSDKEYIIYLTLANITMMGIYFLIYRKTLIKDFKNFFKNFGDNLEVSLKYWLIGFGVMVVSNLFITFILNKEIAGNEEQVRNYLDLLPLFMIFNTVIYAPISEELTFRKSIKDAISNKWVYVMISGVIFGLLHIINYITSPIDLIYLIPYSALGVSFALLYYKTDNIFSCITVHAIHNSLAVITYLLGALL